VDQQTVAIVERRYNMLKEFKPKTYIGIGCGIFLTYFLYAVEPKIGSCFLISLVGLGLSILSMVLFIWGCCCYAKGKGHHGAWGLLGFLFIPGLIILTFFRDMHKKNRKEDDALFEIEDLDELLTTLIKRKYWKEINPDIIKRIFDNAKGDVDTMKRFIFISEIHNSVGNNFVELANGTSKELVLSLFALTLYRLGSELLKAASSAKTDEEIKSLGVRAETAFMSSILCDSFYLESYFGMACLFSPINKDVSLEWCAKYKKAEGKLLNTPNEELNTVQLSLKKSFDPEPEELLNLLEEIVEKAPHLPPDGWEENEGKTMRDKIYELEAELLQA
jgi:hypothetical protein